MKIGATVVNMDCEAMARESMEYLVENTSDDSLVFLTDNGSLNYVEDHPDYQILRISQNDGINLIWYKMRTYLEENNVDVLVCGHADFFIVEKNWDLKVKQAFEEDDKLILAGFVGSPGIGGNGGRTHGVYLNFMGNTYRNGVGSPHTVHGSRLEGIKPAGCFDHCCMIYKVDAFDIMKGFYSYPPPPMHFEDRFLPTAANYNGFHCAIIGVDCDHTSGAKATGMENYNNAVKRWLDKEGMKHPEDGNYDRAAYLEAEKQFLTEWRDNLSFIPFHVRPDYTVMTRAKLS